MSPATALSTQEVESLRKDFPILHQSVHDRPLVYLDNAATTHKPRQVIQALVHFYEHDNSNIHRGIHQLSQRATHDYEEARTKLAGFLNAAASREIIFTGGTTDSINLVAQSWGRANVGTGDEILISEMEHHSNLVPWQMLCEEQGARLRVVPINERGELVFEEFERMLSPRTKLVSVVHISNALGTVNPIREIVSLAHEQGVPVLVDGAQSVPHRPVDVRELDCDFFACSGHKMFGPTGIGVLYARSELLEAMPPWKGGGEMIESVSFEKTTYAEVPHKFEAGTPHIAGAVGLGAAVDYLNDIGMERIAAYEKDLLQYGTEQLQAIAGVELIGTAAEKAGVLSFVVEGVHAHDVGTVLDLEGVAVRTGHHCAQPVMDHFGVPATNRASLAFYNTREEIDALVRALGKVAEVFG